MHRLVALMVFAIFASCSALYKDHGEIISRPFTSVDADREIVLSSNRNFQIMLPSNPTTGYDWILSNNRPDVITAISHKFIKDVSGRVGVGGETTWNLKTKKIGEAELSFSYQRAWVEGVPPTRVVTFKIVVR